MQGTAFDVPHVARLVGRIAWIAELIDADLPEADLMLAYLQDTERYAL